MGNLCNSGNSDLVGDQEKTEKPVIGVSKPARKRTSEMAGDHGNITIINKPAEWDAKIEEAKSTGKIVVVDFTATWCGPCRLMAPIFTELSKKFSNLIFLKVDVDEVQDVTAKWEVRAMPTFIFIQNGKQIDKIIGANKDELERKVAHFANLNVTASA